MCDSSGEVPFCLSANDVGLISLPPPSSPERGGERVRDNSGEGPLCLSAHDVQLVSVPTPTPTPKEGRKSV